MNNNYYLSLLLKKVREMEEALKDLDSSDFPKEYKKNLISGYIITLDSILEIGMSNLHSSKLQVLYYKDRLRYLQKK